MPFFATRDKTDGFVIDSLPGAKGDLFVFVTRRFFVTIMKRSEM